jgi:hypothetical protein
MALPAGGVSRARRACIAGLGVPSSGALGVGLLSSGKDPEVDVLDGLDLLGSAVVPSCLGHRRPDALSMGIG